jgi:IS4 transposase
LNELFVRSEFHCGAADERELANKMIDSVMQDENYKEEAQVWLFDRGFPSLQLMYHLLEQKRKFVMRVSSNFLKEVNEFRRSKYIDRQISVTCTKRRIRSAQIQCEENTVLNLRCVRIHLSSGAEEILITNLERAEFPKRDLKKLYSLRWGIETSFNYLKNAVFVEEFTSRTENGLAQEYFVSLLMYNFSTCMFGSMQKDIPKKESTNTR